MACWGTAIPAVVASAFAFYARGLGAWGDEVLGSVPGIERLADLARRIADSVHPMGLPLFAGWRAEPAPSGPAAAAAQALQVLRELRGDLHLHAVAHQLTPLQAILGKDGPERARELRYPEPFPPLAEFADRRQSAEDLTDHLVAPAYATLTPTERKDMLALLDPAKHTRA